MPERTGRQISTFYSLDAAQLIDPGICDGPPARVQSMSSVLVQAARVCAALSIGGSLLLCLVL